MNVFGLSVRCKHAEFPVTNLSIYLKLEFNWQQEMLIMFACNGNLNVPFIHLNNFKKKHFHELCALSNHIHSIQCDSKQFAF